jgi:glycosyltransferase involved in cell wall biosynthesis
MRILEVAPSYAPEANGIAEVASRVAKGLARRQHVVEVATGMVPGGEKESVEGGVKVHRFAIAGNAVEGIRASGKEISRYVEFLHSVPWDVIHFHTGQSWTLDLVSDQISALPGKHVFTPHGTRLGALNYSAYYKRLVSVYAAFDIVTCLSETFGERPFAGSHGLRNTVVIPNGIEPSEYGIITVDVRRLWRVEDRPFVVNLSNHNPLKGHSRLFDLADCLSGTANVCNIGNGHRAAKWGLGRLGVIGGCYYSCHLRASRTASLQMHSLPDRASIASALAAANVFVLTSTWEASPLVILEAMASGLPWVSFDVGNVHEYPGGFIVSSVPEMADRVCEIVGSLALARTLAEAGRAHVHEHNRWQVVLDAYEGLFVKLLSGERVVRRPCESLSQECLGGTK